MYADYVYYSTEYKGTMPEEDAEKALKQAERHIDTLTYNRINGCGFERLTTFQQDIVKECACITVMESMARLLRLAVTARIARL